MTKISLLLMVFSKEPFDINKVLYYSKFVFGIGKGWGN